MTPSIRADIHRWIILTIAAVLIAVAWLKPLDHRATTQIEAGLKRALATYAVARTINGVISVVQETGVSVQPGGIGMTFAPGQLLDPLNDLVEQVSSIMLAVCVSFGVQLILVHIGESVWVSALLTASIVAAAALWWARRPVPRWASKLLLAMLLVRFAVPVASIGAEMAFGLAMADDYTASQTQLEQAASGAAKGSAASDADSKAETAPASGGAWEFFKKLAKVGEAKPEPPQEVTKTEQIRARLDHAVDHILRLVSIFVVQTVLLPLLFMALLVKLLGAALIPRRISPRRQDE